MPQFYFNLHRGPKIEPDVDGTAFPDDEAAITAAKNFLPALAADRSWGHACDLDVVVLNEAGEGIFTASLRLTATRLSAPRAHQVSASRACNQNKHPGP